MLSFALIACVVTAQGEPVLREPRAAVRGTFVTGIPDMAALSGGLFLAQLPVEIDAGLSASLGSASIWARAGLRASTTFATEGGRARTVAASILVGPRYLLTENGVGQGFHPNVVGTLDLWWWSGRQSAVAFQLAAGFIYLVDGTESGPSRTPFFPDLRLSVGIGF